MAWFRKLRDDSQVRRSLSALNSHLRRNLKHRPTTVVAACLPCSALLGRTIKIARSVENQAASRPGAVGFAHKRVEHGKGPTFARRSQLEYCAACRLASTTYARCPENVAPGIEDNASSRLSPVTLALETVQHAFRPRPVRVVGQFEYRARPRAASSATQGCSIEVALCVEDQARRRHAPIGSALKAVQHRFCPSPAFLAWRPQLESGATTLVRMMGAVVAADVSGTVDRAVC